jgi:hypothetical protein
LDSNPGLFSPSDLTDKYSSDSDAGTSHLESSLFGLGPRSGVLDEINLKKLGMRGFGEKFGPFVR